MSKLLEKLIVKELSRFYKANLKLYKGQIDVRKNRYTIDGAAIIVENMHRSWDQKKIVKVLFIYIKRAFDYISRGMLAQRIRDLKIDNNLIGWM